MNNFWEKLDKNFLAMAPMAGITDSAFRQLCMSFGCDVSYSEMASATALFYDLKKPKNLKNSETLKLLEFSEMERPFVVQLFGSDPEHFKTATEIVTKQIKPDGIDINFGCPVKKIQKQGAGAVLMDNLPVAKKVIEAVIQNTDLPVSIKTRVKSQKNHIYDFLDYISDLDLKALMIHGRTLKQMFTGELDFKAIKEVRKRFQGVLMVNGGIFSYKDAEKILKTVQADGLGLARGAMGRPWLFEEIKKKSKIKKEKKEILDIALKQAKLVFALKGEKGLIEMRKHLCWYVNGLPGARKLREKLVFVKTIDDIEKIFKDF